MNAARRLNPFALGGVVTGKRFAGRVREIGRLQQIARGGQHAYLFAPRRYGKTSLLREGLGDAERAKRQVVVWCDCLPTTDAAGLALRLAEQVTLAARRGRVSEWIKRAVSLFTRLRPVLTVGPDGDPRVSVDVAQAGAAAVRSLEDAIAAVGGLDTPRRPPVVLIFDEFQQIAEWDTKHQTEAVLRTAIQHFEGVSCIFAGSERHLLEQMFADRARPLFKLAAPFPLGRLSREEIEPWLAERLGETGLTLESEGLDRLLVTTAGHPWATQYLAHFVWEVAMAARAARITADLVNASLRQAVEAGDTIYARDYAALTPSQRQVLAAIATDPTRKPLAAAYLRKHDLPAKSTVGQSLRSLLEKGYLERDELVYVASDPLFGEWMRRLRPVSSSVTIPVDR